MPVCYGPNLNRFKEAMAARCEDCSQAVFDRQDDALCWVESEPAPPRFCGHCEARRDVLGIPFDRPGPIPDDELARLYREPREMGG